MGFHHAKGIEQVRNKFCRFVLKVGKNSPICAVIGELGHLPMHIIRKQRILKYWLKIVTKKPPIVFNVYKMLVNDAENGKTNWASNVRTLLNDLGYNFLWYNQENVFFSYDVLKRLYDQFIQSWRSSMLDCEKLDILKMFKIDFCLEKYLLLDVNVKLLTQLRCGSLKLNIETGRYNNVPRNERLCQCCNMKAIENEYHFVMICPAYRHLRLRFLPKYYCSWPNM